VKEVYFKPCAELDKKYFDATSPGAIVNFLFYVNIYPEKRYNDL
jgi:hypothetical protein